MNITPPNDRDYFFDALYGERRGYIELFTIEGDPDDRDNCNRRQHWFVYAPWHKAKLSARIDELAALYGNVYVSATLYSKPKREKQYALDGDVIVVDDAAPSNYTFTVQTSPSSMHAYRKLNKDVDSATREELARREAYATDADKGGWDITQLVRVPGTFNTKQKHIDANGGEPYPVTLHPGNGRTFTPEELRERYPAAPAHKSIGEVSADWEPAQRWIANPELLITDSIPQLPRRMRNTPNALGRRVLEGTHTRMSASGLPDTSLMRFIAIKSLVMFGYPDDEIRAIAWLLLGYGAEDRKGTEWLRRNINGSIAGAREQCATEGRRIPINPTTGIFVRPSTPAPMVQGSRARKDRPQTVTEAAYLAWCHNHIDTRHEVAHTRKEIAAALGISMSTVVRLERKLQGALERYTSADRRRSWLAVYVKPMMTLPSAPAVETVPEVAEMVEQEPAPVLSSSYAYIGTPARREEPTAPIAPAPTPSASPPNVDMATGEVNPGEPERVSFAVRSMIELCGRPSLQRVQRLLAEYYPGHTWTPVRIAYHYRAQLAARRWERTLDALGTMKQAKLTRLERCCERILTEGKSGPQANRLGWATMMHPHILTEQERREPMKQRTKARGNRGKPTQLGLADVATMAAVDVVRNSAEVSRAWVPPSSTVVVPPAPRPTIASVIQTFYRCFDVGNFDKASTAVRDYPQLADLYEKAQAAQQVTP